MSLLERIQKVEEERAIAEGKQLPPRMKDEPWWVYQARIKQLAGKISGGAGNGGRSLRRSVR